MAEVLVDSQLEMLDAAADAPALDETPAHEEEGVEAAAPVPSKPKNLYFVRVPRPQIDEAPVKELQTKLAATLAKLKEYNAKLAGKRVRPASCRSDRCREQTMGGVLSAAGALQAWRAWHARCAARGAHARAFGGG